MSNGARRGASVVALVIGLGLVVAPFAFQMFSRAPQGGDMIDDFEPYMSTEVIERFRGYLDTVDAADAQASDQLQPALADAGAVPAEDFDTTYVQVASLREQWPDVQADMTDLLDTMDRNLDNYDAVASLPPFPLFPWFFVIPGVLVAGAATWALLAGRRGRSTRPAAWVLVALGVGLVLAPVAFQMFSRAPQGGDMIEDFEPMMTRERVQRVQGYFITMGAAEGQLRNQALPALAAAEGATPEETAEAFPQITALSDVWPTIVTDFAPMVSTMSDNVDNFDAVASLPPFPLFPWFFLIPGLLVAGCGVVALTARPAEAGSDTTHDESAAPVTPTPAASDPEADAAPPEGSSP
ncbi:MAG: hypothetical protein MUF83_03905 [Acidimicrobiales bacterium]|jgi:hypothetical protein|nr:hypothetical protein [Acidimicrobiales bacterium]